MSQQIEASKEEEIERLLNLYRSLEKTEEVIIDKLEKLGFIKKNKVTLVYC